MFFLLFFYFVDFLFKSFFPSYLILCGQKKKRTKGISYIAFSVSTIKISWLGYLNYCRPNYTQRNKLRGVYAYIMRILFLTLSVRQLARQPLVFCKRNSSFTAAWNFLKLSMYWRHKVQMCILPENSDSIIFFVNVGLFELRFLVIYCVK